MSLKVSKTLELNEINYEAPEENTGSNKSSTTSGKSSDVVDFAKSFIGKLTYVFGGKNIAGGSGDCSGFTQYVFQKSAGVNIGHGTATQITKGSKVSKDDAQPGDLIFFQGTYRAGVSHVGIVTKKGYFVGLGNSGCKEASYTSGYWDRHFMQIRRV
jgi:cell wall-associated NlpC family hydrolase